MDNPVSWLMSCYSKGVFPMAEGLYGDIYLYDPNPRAVLPFESVYVSRRLKKTIKQKKFELSVNKAPEIIIRKCRRESGNVEEIWLNDELLSIYLKAQEMGLVHTFEAWRGGILVGGLYGVALGGAFFAESMFHDSNYGRDASKVVLAVLTAELRLNGFKLFDIQFLSSHLSKFGAVELPREVFHLQLRDALSISCLIPNSLENGVREFTS